jgi:hypothetical protein
MPDINRASDVQELVINTGPLLALIAALGNFENPCNLWLQYPRIFSR